MKQPEGFVETGYKDYVCKLVHMICGTMQGGHDWYKTLSKTYNNLGYTTRPLCSIQERGQKLYDY